MAQKIINARAKNKRDTSANWTANDPVLLDGEIIIVDTAEGEVRIKIGDGTKKYSQLPFEDEKLRNLLNNKLDKTATAADSAKLNGQEASHYAVDSDVVHKTGAETIAGVKTFSDNIKVGSSSIGTNGYIEGTWLKTTAASDSKGNFCTLNNGWIYYRTPAEVLTDIGGQAKITASGILKGDGSGGVSAATANTDYLPVSNANLKGTPTAPTAAKGTNTTQVATTAFVQNALSGISAKGFEFGTTAPKNTNLLWIDTTNGSILKYYNGSAWTAVNAVFK